METISHYDGSCQQDSSSQALRCVYNVSGNPFSERACGATPEDHFSINPYNVIGGLVGIALCDEHVEVPLCGEHIRQIDLQPEEWDVDAERRCDARQFWRKKRFEVECEDAEETFFVRVVARNSKEATEAAEAAGLEGELKVIRTSRIPSADTYRGKLMPERRTAVPKAIRAQERAAEEAQRDAERAQRDAEQRAEQRAQRIADGTLTWEDLATEADVLQRQGTEIKYVAQDLIPSGRITMLYGQEKGCKSLLALYFQKCVANGIKVLDTYDTVKTPCLYFDREDGVLGTYVDWMADLGPERVKFLTLRDCISKLDDKNLIRICQEHRPLIVLDSLHKFMGEGKNSWRADDVEPMMGKMRDLCVHGATIILIHHSLKSDKEQYRDSSVIGAGVDFMYAVVGAEPRADGVKNVELIGKPSRGAQPPTLNLVAFPSLPDLGCFTLRGAPINDTKTLVLNYVEEHPGCSAKSVTDGVPGRREKILIVLQELVGSGHVIDKGCDGKGAYHRTAFNYSPPVIANMPRESRQSKKKKTGVRVQ